MPSSSSQKSQGKARREKRTLPLHPYNIGSQGIIDYSTVEALHSSTIPVMLIHGTDDHFVPVEMSYENYKACSGPKRLLIVPGADHGMSYFVEKDRYEEEIKRFWRDFD